MIVICGPSQLLKAKQVNFVMTYIVSICNKIVKNNVLQKVDLQLNLPEHFLKTIRLPEHFKFSAALVGGEVEAFYFL